MSHWIVLVLAAGCARQAPPEPAATPAPAVATEAAPAAAPAPSPPQSQEASLEILRAAFRAWKPEEVTLAPECTLVLHESTGAGTEYRLPLARLSPTLVDAQSGQAYLKLYCVSEACVEATIHEPLRPNYNFELIGDEAAVLGVVATLESLAAPCR